jgi:hypothetical protein
LRYVWQNLQLTEDADLQDLQDMTDLVCAMNMTELVAFDPGNSYATQSCFQGNFIFQLLTETYKLPQKGTPLIVGDTDADWAPGFFVNEMNDMKLAAVKDVNYDSRPDVEEVYVAEVGSSASSFVSIPSWIGIVLLVSYDMFA